MDLAILIVEGLKLIGILSPEDRFDAGLHDLCSQMLVEKTTIVDKFKSNTRMGKTEPKKLTHRMAEFERNGL